MPLAVMPFSVFVGVLALLAQGPASRPAFSRDSAAAAARLAIAAPGLSDGDYDRAIEALLEKVGNDPDSPLAVFLANRAAAWLDRTADRGAALGRFAALAENPKIPARLQKRLASIRVELAMRKGDENAFLRGGDRLPQYLAKAAIIGPFGDAVPDALAVPYEPERGLSLRAKAPGLGYQRTVEWQPVARRPFESHLDLTPISDPPGGVRYIKAQVRSSSARQGYVVLSAPGSVAVWWNGEEAARQDLARDLRRPLDPIPVLLRAGWNQLLVKLESRGASWVALGLVEADGTPIVGLEEEGALVDREIGPKPEGIAAPPPFETLDRKVGLLLASLRDGDAARADLQALRGVFLSLNERPSEALADLRAASDADPKRADLAYALAEGTLAANYLPDSELKNRAREAVERALAADPKHVPALLLRADLLARDDRMEEALATLDEAAKANPKSHLVPMSRVGIFGKLGWQAERRKALDEAYAKAPRKVELHLDLAREARNMGDAVRERKELDAAAELDASNWAVSSRRSELWCLGSEGARALSEWEKWVRWYRRPQDRANLARALESLGRFDEALAIRKEIARAAPRDVQAQIDLAQMERSMRRDLDAKKTYEAVLPDNPGNGAVRTWMREVGGGFGGDEFFAKYRPDAMKAIRDYKPAKDHERAPDVLVVDFQAERVLPDGSSEMEIVSVYRINDQKGIEAHGSADFPGELRELKVVHPDGTVDEPTPAQGDYALPNLKAGDFILVRSHVHDEASPGERPMRGKFQFQSQEKPYVVSQYVLALPKGADIRLVEKNFDGEHTVEESDQEVVHVMTKTNSPRILPEALQPNPDVFLPWVRAGESATVGDLDRSYRAQFLRSMDLTEEIKTAAREAVAKAGAKTDREKAAALYAFTNDRLIERGGGTATRSLLEKRGSSFALFGALLRAEQVPFDVAMARGIPVAGDDEREAHFLETTRYRYPLFKIAPREGGDPLWVDVGLRLQPFGALPASIAGSEIFVTSDGEPKIEVLPTVPDAEAMAFEIETVAKLTGGKKADVTIDVVLHNQAAWSLRERIRNFTADVRKTVAAQVSNRFAEGIELEKFDFPTLDDNAAPLRIRLEGSIANFLRDGAAGVEAPLLLQPQLLAKQLSGRSKRKLPMHFPSPQILHEKLRIVPGPGQSLGALPASASKSSHTVRYELKVGKSGEALEIDRTLRLGAGTIPAADFSQFLGVCREIEEAEQAKVPVAEATGAESKPAESKPAGGER